MWYLYVLLCLFGYLIGSVNFAVIFTRINHKDIKKMGSGNPGTMNMVRNMGAKWGALTLCCDVAKSALSSYLGLVFIGTTGLYAAGLASVVGHIYPAYMKFKGGKGVACAIGVFAVASPLTSLIAFGCLLVFLLVFQYGSLSSLLFVTVLTVEQGVKYGGDVSNIAIILMVFAIWLLVWFGHRENIVRAILGKEHKSNILDAFKKVKTGKKK